MRPAARTVAIAGAWLALSVAAAFHRPLLAPWAVAGAVALVVAVADAVLARRRKPLGAERTQSSSLALGAWSTVKLRVLNPGPRSETVDVWDGVPGALGTEGLPRRLDVPPESGAEIEYRVRALRRGEAALAPAELLRRSPLGLWVVRERAGPTASVRVYPNFAAVAGFTLHALESRIQLMGIRRKRLRGEGFEFRQLRDYQVGDVLRQIDWKATSRRRKPISREYQEERDQRIAVVLDCGRRMRATDGELTYFDHCLNAVLLLAYLALRQGDAISLTTFGGVDRHLPPVKGRASMTALLNAVYDLEPTLEPSDFLEAAQRVQARQGRRALIVIVTNQRDEDDDDLRPALELLRKRHLVVLASLREVVVDQLADAPIATHADAVRSCAALDYLASRRRALERASGLGVLQVDVAPSRLPLALAEKYLEIKRAGRL
jgi:uncharacterized protein (DUF58 family)